MAYTDFLQKKLVVTEQKGFAVNPVDLNSKLFAFQRAIVQWALKLGRAAIFAECGLGKTLMQLAWAHQVVGHTGQSVLILAPLAVTHQTVLEGKEFGIPVSRVDEPDDMSGPDIYVANYERVAKFADVDFAGVVLDESSILKNLGGKTFWQLVRQFEHTDYRLCCTATPAPNDFVEFSNHSTFLGIMHFKEVLARWFIGDQALARSAILKGHAATDFWRWLTSWAVCISKPSDLGEPYAMDGFNLPPLEKHEHRLAVSQATLERTWKEGMLLPDTRPTATTLYKVKKESLSDRVAKAVEIVNHLPDGTPVVIWCDTNAESDALKAALPQATDVRGSHTSSSKQKHLTAFSADDIKLLITKPSIAGFGMNWQHCQQHIFIGVSFSFEKFYQAIRRSYRFGQEKPVHAHIIYAESEGNVLTILKEKQKAFDTMQAEMNQAMKEHGLFRDVKALTLTEPKIATMSGMDWTLHLGDCVTRIKDIPDNSIHLTVSSPPFANLYIYSDSVADMGNSADDDEFFEHFEYLIEELYRVTVPGRLCVMHCKDLPLFRNRDGVMGLDDFPGKIIQAFQKHGWAYHSKVTIWKDPVIEMERTKNHGLLHKNFTKQAEVCRQGMPDYLVVFRKWSDDMKELGEPVIQHREIGDYLGENEPEPWEYRDLGRRTPREKYSIAVWQRYASPVWMDINQMNVLNYQQAKAVNDEKHICPLQLDVIERCIDLWTNEGDMVFDPFNGIGSTGHCALKANRKYTGIELKESYFNTAQRYLQAAARQMRQPTLWNMTDLLPEAKTS